MAAHLRHDGGARVVVTGVGAVTPAGSDVATTLAAILAARPTAAPITAWKTDDHPVDFACQVDELHLDGVLAPREARRIDRAGLFALLAAEEAIADAGLTGLRNDEDDSIDRRRAAAMIGSGVGGILTLEEQILVRAERGPDRVSPLLIPMMMANAPAGLVALRHGLGGRAQAIATACASGTDAIGAAADLIRSGRADVVVTGGTEAPITPTAMAAFARMSALSTRTDDPSAASRPFDRDRDGFVMGEGAGVLVLESAEHAERRGATVVGEILGYGATCDAHHITAPDPGARGAAACISAALADAGIAPDAIGHVNAHGTSTPLNDAAETLAIEAVFGPNGPPVTSTKGVTGHLVGAAGAVEAIVALRCAVAGTVPPTANLRETDVAASVDLVSGSVREIASAPALSTSFGFGGHNAALVLAPVAAS